MLNFMMEQPADGYTVFSMTNSNLATMARKNTTAQRDDIIGIARGCYDPQAFMISTKGPYKSIQEILEVATRTPLDDAPERLVELANERGGDDNITVVLVYVANDAG